MADRYSGTILRWDDYFGEGILAEDNTRGGLARRHWRFQSEELDGVEPVVDARVTFVREQRTRDPYVCQVRPEPLAGEPDDR